MIGYEGQNHPAGGVSNRACLNLRLRPAPVPHQRRHTRRAADDRRSQGNHRGHLERSRPHRRVQALPGSRCHGESLRLSQGDQGRRWRPRRPGQLLATLEVPEIRDDLSKADAAVVRAQAEVARAQDELRRAESSHRIAHLSFERLSGVIARKPGLLAQQEIDEAQSRDLVAEAQVASAKSAIAAVEEQVKLVTADTRKVKTLIDYTRVTAPFTGVITRRYGDPGSMIQAGTASQTQAMPVVRLSQTSTLRLILPVPESSVPSVHIGQSVEVRVPTLNRTFPGRVARFTGKLASSTRTMDTEVDVQNPGLILLPGMYAEVDLTLAKRNKVLTVP